MDLSTHSAHPNSPVPVSTVKYTGQISNVSKSGTLKKYDHYRFQWSNMRVVLLSHELRLYLDANDSVPNCVLPLCDFVVYAVDERSVGMKNAFYIVTPGESFLFATETPAEQQEWIEILSPFSRPSHSTIVSTPSTPSNVNKNQIPYNPSPPTPPLTRSNSYAAGSTRKSLTPSNSYVKSRISSPNHHVGYMLVPGSYVSPHLNIIHPQTNVTPVKTTISSQLKSPSSNLNSTIGNTPQKISDTNSPGKINEPSKIHNSYADAIGDSIALKVPKATSQDASVGTEENDWCDVSEALLILENEIQEYQATRDSTIYRLQQEAISLREELQELNAKYIVDQNLFSERIKRADLEAQLLNKDMEDLKEELYHARQQIQTKRDFLLENAPVEIDYAELESRLQQAYEEIRTLKDKLDESSEMLSASRIDISSLSFEGDTLFDLSLSQNLSLQKKGKRRSTDYAVTAEVCAHHEKLSKDLFQIVKSPEAKQTKADDIHTQLRNYQKTMESSHIAIFNEVKDLENKYKTSSFELQKKTTEHQRLHERHTKLENEFKILMKACKSLKDEKQSWDAERAHFNSLLSSAKSDTPLNRSLDDHAPKRHTKLA